MWVLDNGRAMSSFTYRGRTTNQYFRRYRLSYLKLPPPACPNYFVPWLFKQTCALINCKHVIHIYIHTYMHYKHVALSLDRLKIVSHKWYDWKNFTDVTSFSHWLVMNIREVCLSLQVKKGKWLYMLYQTVPFIFIKRTLLGIILKYLNRWMTLFFGVKDPSGRLSPKHRPPRLEVVFFPHRRFVTPPLARGSGWSADAAWKLWWGSAIVLSRWFAWWPLCISK
jgi:hypothetical protein